MSFRSKKVSLRVILDHIEVINLGTRWSKMGIDLVVGQLYNLGRISIVEICLTFAKTYIMIE